MFVWVAQNLSDAPASDNDVRTPVKPFADELGPRARRVVQVMASADGSKWTPLAPPLPPSSAHPAHPPQPVVLAPNISAGDPEDLEFASFVPWWCGDRLSGVVTNYAPLPVPACASIDKADAHCPAAANDRASEVAMPGTTLAQEWWVAARAASGSGISQGTLLGSPGGWRRPYLLQTQSAGTTALSSPGMAATPPGFKITHPPLQVPQTITSIAATDGMIWLWRNAWFGIMLFRLGGLYAPANAEFSSGTFMIPTETKSLWLNMDNRAHLGQTGLGGDMPDSYIMVALLPAGGAGSPPNRTAIPGFEAERCVLPKLSQQGYPLSWKQDNGSHLSGGVLSGTTVRARIYMRKATVYGIGVRSLDD